MSTTQTQKVLKATQYDNLQIAFANAEEYDLGHDYDASDIEEVVAQEVNGLKALYNYSTRVAVTSTIYKTPKPAVTSIGLTGWGEDVADIFITGRDEDDNKLECLIRFTAVERDED